MQEAVQTKASRAKKTRSLTSLDWRRTVLVTLPFMGALTFWQAYDGLIPLMLKNTFGLGDTAPATCPTCSTPNADAGRPS